MKKAIWALCIAAVIGWFVWPYYAIYQFWNALRDADPIALESRVDWDSVRQGLRGDINAMYTERFAKMQAMSNSSGGGLGTGLAAMFAPGIINAMVDTYVTPQAIATLIRSGEMPKALEGDKPSARTISRSQDHLDFSRVQYAFFSGGPFTFLLTLKPPPDLPQDKTMSLRFKWDGDWRLARIFLPLPK